MRVVTPTDLRKRLGEILDAASAGERFLIERDRKPLAVLVSVEAGERLDEAADAFRERRLAALDRLESLARRIAEEHHAPAGDAAGAVDAVRADRERDRENRG
jgi:prevent-host-death family protein